MLLILEMMHLRFSQELARGKGHSGPQPPGPLRTVLHSLRPAQVTGLLAARADRPSTKRVHPYIGAPCRGDPASSFVRNSLVATRVPRGNVSVPTRDISSKGAAVSSEHGSAHTHTCRHTHTNHTHTQTTVHTEDQPHTYTPIHHSTHTPTTHTHTDHSTHTHTYTHRPQYTHTHQPHTHAHT